MHSTPVYLEEYLELHPADLADRLQRLPVEEVLDLLRQIPRPKAAATLVELDKEKAVQWFRHFPVEEVIALFQELPPDAVADLVADLPAVKRREVLTGLPPEKAEAVRAVMAYPEDTAGGIMSTHFVVLKVGITVQEAQEQLQSWPEERAPDIAYLYVIDDIGRLVGVASLRDLVFARPERHIEEIMNREVKFVRVDADKEEIARQFEHYHYLGLPVLDSQGRLVGVVKASDALHIAQAEATEDMQLMVGLSGEERALTPWYRALGKRLPWLYINLATAFLAGGVVSLFEGTIAKWTSLAIFLPIIAGQGGNAGSQTLTVIIRDLALGELSAGDGRKALFKEIMLGLVNGIAIGVVVGLAGYFWQGSPRLGVVAALAMLMNLLAAAFAGVLIPLGLKWFKIDPALASSIFLTTVTDVAGFFFFLGFATLALAWFP